MFLTSLLSPWIVLLFPVLYYALPYIRNWTIRNIPGPIPAAFTSFWLLYQCRRGRRCLSVDDAHKRYGKMVRIQPNHVSIADPAAIPVVYGHGNDFFAKSEYYNAFVSIDPTIFNTRDRTTHARKRKTISHTFSAKSIAQFEKYMYTNLATFTGQWDRLSDSQKGSPTGYAYVDSLHWFNYLAFDIIGDLAFGAPFGMLEAAQDIAKMQRTPESPVISTPAIEVLNKRGEVSATLGCLPELQAYVRWLPDRFFANGIEAVRQLAGIATARVEERMKPEALAKNTRMDMLAKLTEGRDEKGQSLGRREITAEAQTLMIAGSDTTSNSACALLYWCLRTPGVPEKLRLELEQVVPAGVEIPDFKTVKDLPYLRAVINEALRIHSTSAVGLPRIVPPTVENAANAAPGGGVTILGHVFPPGTCLSVPTYTIHHSKAIWGPDADDFNPDRWAEDTITADQKAAFIPFSYGPRACLGRNIAEMELMLFTSVVFWRYDMILAQGKDEWRVREGFLRKPSGLRVGVRRRERSST